jgi:hypothetical protein
MEEINALLEKYDNFKYEQIRSVQHLSDGSKVVTLVIQDDDGEDTDTINIQFSDIKDLRILDSSVLSFLDMSSGITIIKENGLYGFAIGSGTAMLHVHNAPFYIVATEIKVLEEK